MIRVSLKGLWAHRRRLAGTFLAVFLAVAFQAGTLVLSDTLRANFDDLFADANAGTDAVVRSTTDIQADGGNGPAEASRGLISSALLAPVRAVPGVAAAEPSIEGFGQLLGRDGEVIGGNGPPRLAGNWITDPDLNPYQLVDGRAPAAMDEVVVNRGAAEAGDLRVGDVTTVQTPEPVRVRIAGIATFGSADGLGETTYTAFTAAAAERYITKKPGQLSGIVVEAAPGVSQDELVRRLRPVLPGGVETISGAEVTSENVDDINGQFLDLFSTFLLVFAGIALLVATFSIYNTFSILVAQRTADSALLRALGASRGQVLLAGVVESLLVGLVASAAGVLGGFGIAGLLKGVFDSFGFALPAGGLVVSAASVLVSFGVGVLITLLAGVLPALKASRVAPLAALREVSVDRTAASLVRAVAGFALAAAGAALVLGAVTLDGVDGSAILPLAGAGAVLTIVGVVVFGPVVARTAGRVLGFPLPRLRGVTGVLARNNAMRNPRRTAGTAAALLVGVCVVTLFTVFAASLRATIDDGVSRSFGGDLAISAPTFGGGGFSPRLAAEVAALPEVDGATGLSTGAAVVDGAQRAVSVAEPARLGEVLDLDVTAGSVDRLGSAALAVSGTAAEDNGWRLGSRLRVGFADGTTTMLTVGAVYTDRNAVGDFLIPRATWTPHVVQDVDTQVLVTLADGVDMAAGKAALRQAVSAYGGADVQDREEYADAAAGGVDMLLGLVYVMLALAILIALMGIANTLSLSVHERTRELGLLRAVGQTRGQLRAMVRWESVIVAVFGTLGGLGLGLFLGWALGQAASTGMQTGGFTFAAPVVQLAVVLAGGAVAGVLAGLRPARRAARLNVLAAIAAD